MTLTEAYEKLRLEAISLRRENAELKVGSYMDADRASNEKEIRHLNWELINANRDKERYYALWRKCLSKGSDDIKDELYSVKKQLEEANETIAKLKAQMNREHENSSFASS